MFASSFSTRLISSSLDLALRKSEMKFCNPRAWDDMVGVWVLLDAL